MRMEGVIWNHAELRALSKKGDLHMASLQRIMAKHFQAKRRRARIRQLLRVFRATKE